MNLMKFVKLLTKIAVENIKDNAALHYLSLNLRKNDMQRIESIEGVSWTEVQEPTNCDKIIDALEQGKIVFFPHLTFHIEKKELLSTNIVSENRKNVSYDSKTQCLSGCTKDAKKQADLKALMRSFAEKSKILVETSLPHYRNHLMIGRTSFRPIEIEGREAPSYRKDDKLLHVDAFPSTPVQGFRILRVFSNINPDGKPRIWRIGEPFENVVKTFLPQLKRPLPGSAMFLKMLRI